MLIKSPGPTKHTQNQLISCLDSSQHLCACVLRLPGLQLGALVLCCRVPFPRAASQPTLCGCLGSPFSAHFCLLHTQPDHQDFQFHICVADTFLSSPDLSPKLRWWPFWSPGGHFHVEILKALGLRAVRRGLLSSLSWFLSPHMVRPSTRNLVRVIRLPFSSLTV